jgi:hypothetical protein
MFDVPGETLDIGSYERPAICFGRRATIRSLLMRFAHAPMRGKEVCTISLNPKPRWWAALQHLWKRCRARLSQTLFSRKSPLERITSFLQWVQRLQRERHCTAGHVLGWPFFSLGCELGAGEPAIRAKLCAVESAELGYFESAIRDAMDDDAIEPGDSHAQALSLRAAMEGILARARILDELDELNALSALPTILLRRNTWKMDAAQATTRTTTVVEEKWRKEHKCYILIAALYLATVFLAGYEPKAC